MAFDAYTDDQRVLGNSPMARARTHITAVDERLADLVNRLETDAVARTNETLRATSRAVDLSRIMVEMDGFEFLAAIRDMPEYRSVPVVVVTAADLTGEDHRRLNGGVECILPKAA